MGFSEAIIKIELFIIIFLSLFFLVLILKIFFFFLLLIIISSGVIKKLYFLKDDEKFLVIRNLLKLRNEAQCMHRNERLEHTYIPFCSKFRTFVRQMPRFSTSRRVIDHRE